MRLLYIFERNKEVFTTFALLIIFPSYDTYTTENLYFALKIEGFEDYHLPAKEIYWLCMKYYSDAVLCHT